MPDVDGIDTRCAAREQDLGEAARRGADVERDPSLHREAETVEGRDQLGGPARDIGGGGTQHPDVGVAGDGNRGSHLDDAGHLDQAAANEIAGTGAGGRKAPRHQGQIEPGRAPALRFGIGHHRSRICDARSAMPSIRRRVHHVKHASVLPPRAFSCGGAGCSMSFAL